MAAVQKEIILYQVPDAITTEVQQLTPFFYVQQLGGFMANSSKCDFSLKLKIKMAANKPEMAAKWITDTNPSVSQVLWHMGTKFQRLPPIFVTTEHIGVSKDTARCNRKSEMKMAAGKPEILISQLPDEIETRSQRLD